MRAPTPLERRILTHAIPEGVAGEDPSLDAALHDLLHIGWLTTTSIEPDPDDPENPFTIYETTPAGHRAVALADWVSIQPHPSP